MGLTKLAITRPVFIFVMMILTIIMGYMATQRMRVEENPEVQFGTITVTTVYPGAGPEEINTQISRKVEEAVSGINGLLEVTSISQEGVSVVTCQYEVGTNMDVALNDMRAKVDSIANELPQDVEKPTLTKFDSSSTPVMTIAVASPGRSSRDLRDLVDDRLKDRFARIPGVAAISVVGGDVREIQVQVKRDRLLSYGVGIIDINRAIQSASFNIPSGRVINGDRETTVRVLGEFKNVKEIEDMTFTVQDPNNPMGKAKPVRLGDVASIKDSTEERRVYGRLNGKESLSMTVIKIREGNAVSISSAARALMDQVSKEFGLEMVVTQDQAPRISESIADLILALVIGIFLVVGVVYVFLHNLRGTLIVAVAIPVCLMATFGVLWAFGFTINNMTMLALSLAIGVLVDDAIVVLENIYRHLRMGEDPVDAAINGRAEIGLAAIAITLADVVVFVPVAFMGGVVGQFFKPLGIAFATAVILSLFVSFTVTPLLAARWYRAGEDFEHPTGWFAVKFNNFFGAIERGYRKTLEVCLKNRWFVFCFGFAALIGVFMMIMGSMAPSKGAAFASGAKAMLPMVVMITVIAVVLNLIFMRRFRGKLFAGAIFFILFFGLMGFVGKVYGDWKQSPLFAGQFFPASDGGQVQVSIELPSGSSLEATEAVARYVESKISNHPDAKFVSTRIGSKGGGFSPSDNGTQLAQITVTLNEKRAIMDSIMFWKKHAEKLRDQSDIAVAAEMLQAIKKVPGAIVNVSTGQAQGFGLPIQMSFTGDDPAELYQVAEKIRTALAAGKIKGVISPDISAKSGKPEIHAVPDRRRLADAGLSTLDLAQSMRTLYQGANDTKFRVKGKEYDIRVMMDVDDRNNPDIVGTMPVKFQQGNPILLSDVAQLENRPGIDKIERRSRSEEIRVVADLLPGFAAGNVQNEINAWLEAEKVLPPTVKQKNLGQADVQAREGVYLMTALGLGFMLVYFLLAALYNNFLYPFIIQLAQPQALIGALLALILTDKPFNIVGFIGLIALVGLVGKNAILVVDYTNTLRSRGVRRTQALLEAGPTRLRPIAMTTSAVILGMLPVALAIGRGSEFRETIGITIIGGVALSTFLTLLVIPCSYVIFDDISRMVSKRHRENTNDTMDGPEETRYDAPTQPVPHG